MSETRTSFSLLPRAQDQAWKTLVTLSDALPQGLILVGPSGVGKRRSVKALFQLLHCRGRSAGVASAAEASLFGGTPEATPQSTALRESDEPCGTCVSCKKIAEGRHADLIEILPKGENIAVDDLREMKKSLFFSPIEGSVRFVLIDEAHKLNAASANTLLKTLEEPPAHTRFFLFTHERARLLPTILSRCQFVHFAPLDEATLRELLEENGYALPERLERICLSLLAGGMDRAALLSDEKTQAFIETAQRALTANAARWEEVVQLAEQLASPAASNGGTEDWKIGLILDLMTILAHRNAIAGRSNAEALRFARRALEAAYLRRRLERHANKKLIGLAAAELAMNPGAGRS